MVGSNRNIEKKACGDKQIDNKQEKYDARAKYQKDQGCGSCLIPGILFGEETSDGGYGSLRHIHGLQGHFSEDQPELLILWIGMNSGLRRQHPHVNEKFKILLRTQLAFPMLPFFENIRDFNDSSVISLSQDF
jgi:hypothetical protein